MADYSPRWYTRSKTVTNPSCNRARRVLTSFMPNAANHYANADTVCNMMTVSRLVMLVRFKPISLNHSYRSSLCVQRHRHNVDQCSSVHCVRVAFMQFKGIRNITTSVFFSPIFYTSAYNTQTLITWLYYYDTDAAGHARI